jgi:hypothetical protein
MLQYYIYTHRSSNLASHQAGQAPKCSEVVPRSVRSLPLARGVLSHAGCCPRPTRQRFSEPWITWSTPRQGSRPFLYGEIMKSAGYEFMGYLRIYKTLRDDIIVINNLSFGWLWLKIYGTPPRFEGWETHLCYTKLQYFGGIHIFLQAYMGWFRGVL